MSDHPPWAGLHVSGSEIRRLRELREQVKIASLGLPMPLQRKLLELLEQARPWTIPPQPVPEMTRGEVIRAIRWRLGTVPLTGVLAAVRFVAQHRPKTRSIAGTRSSEDGRSPAARPLRFRKRHP
jgi:hypothetical protein